MFRFMMKFVDITFKSRQGSMNSIISPELLKLAGKSFMILDCSRGKCVVNMNIQKICEKYKDIIPYLFFGVCTTVVNIVGYWLMAHMLQLSTIVSTIIAWVIAVFFAYMTNRKWVFHSAASTKKAVMREIISFFSCRIGTGIVDWFCMWLFVERLHVNDVAVKTAANVLVIILNYAASKLVIF